MTDDTGDFQAETELAKAKYRAPALEKGLDILELLSAEPKPLTHSQIAAKLGKSISELFRMLHVLEKRGYVAARDEGYVLTDRLFALGLTRAPIQSLLAAALPVMEELAATTGQSCHLAVLSTDQIVVVARVESPTDLGFSVRIGYRKKLVESASGIVLYGFQPPEKQQAIRDRVFDPAAPGIFESFVAEAGLTVSRGYVHRKSDTVPGVQDIGAPVMGPNGAVASLTVPYLAQTIAPSTVEDVIGHVQRAARKISDVLSGRGAPGA